MMKKTFIIFALSVLLISCSPASSSESSSEIKEENRITISTMPLEKEYLDKVIDLYNSEVLAEDRIEIVYAENYDPTSVSHSADLIFTNDLRLKRYSLNEYALNLDDTDKVDDNVKSLFVYDDCLLAYPTSFNSGYALYYDSTYFDNESEITLESILEKCEQNNKKFRFSLFNPWYILSFFLSPDYKGLNSFSYEYDNGVAIYDIHYDDNEGARMMEYVASLYSRYKDYFIISDGSFSQYERFERGDIIASIDGSYTDNFEHGDYVLNNVKSTKMPTMSVDGKTYQLGSLGCYYGYFIHKDSNKVTASKKLLDYLLREDVQDLMVKEIGTVPVIESALQNIDESINPLYKGQIAQAPYTSFESLCIEQRGYEIFGDIATAVLTSSLGECDTWLEFLTNQFDLIR